MPYNFVADIFTQINFVAYFLQANYDFRRKMAVLRFSAPFWSLGATYHDHLRLIGKRVWDFLLALLLLVLRLRRYERLSVQHRRFRSNGGRLSQNFR